MQWFWSKALCLRVKIAKQSFIYKWFYHKIEKNLKKFGANIIPTKTIEKHRGNKYKELCAESCDFYKVRLIRR